MGIDGFLTAECCPTNYRKSRAKNPNEGRTIELNEVRRIKNEVGHFYFSSPHNINISKHGHLFVQDNKQLLQFNSEGKFQRNLIKIGRGPGEVEEISNYQLTDDELYYIGEYQIEDKS